MSGRDAEYLERGRTDPDGPGPDDPAHLDRLRLALADPATWAEPPPALGDVIATRIAAEEGGDVAVRRPTDRPTAGRGRLLAAAAVVVVAAAAGALLGSWIRGDRPTTDDDDDVTLVATGLVPGASGWAEVTTTGSGLGITLWTDGLPPAPSGGYYQAWMVGEAGAVSVGTFHARSDDGEPIELWSGVDPADHPTLTVTLVDEGTEPVASDDVVLRGDLSPAS